MKLKYGLGAFMRHNASGLFYSSQGHIGHSD